MSIKVDEMYYIRKIPADADTGNQVNLQSENIWKAGGIRQLR